MNPARTLDTEEMDDSMGRGQTIFHIVWLSLWFFFLSLPFCSTQRRRKLCLQRIREMRWIPDRVAEQWYLQRIQDLFHRGDTQQHPRQQNAPSRRQNLQTIRQIRSLTKSQEDMIRERHVVTLLEHYTMILSKSDIYVSSKSDNKSCALDPIGDDDVSSTINLTTKQSFQQESDILDVEAPPLFKEKESDFEFEVDVECNGLKEMDFQDADEFVHVPMPGVQVGANFREEHDEATAANEIQRRQAPSGCAVCLSSFLANERITWSSNVDCSHVFHHDCLLHWFQTVGRKTQKALLERCPNVSEEDVLKMVIKFPKLCPCCRQTFCVEIQENGGDKTKEILETPAGTND